MSTDSIPTRVNGTTIDQTYFNVIQAVLGGDLVPRTAAGTPTTEAGNLGQSTIAWLRAYIQSGYFSLGDIKIHHSYNGAAPIGEGWMLCDGRQITQANYDAEHGSGHWATYIVSSGLLNKYLPNFAGKYPVGVSVNTQGGTVAITSVGSTGNTINLIHSHTTNAHSHTWYSNTTGVAANAQSWNSGGVSTVFTTDGASVSSTGLPFANSGNKISPNYYTSMNAVGTDNQLSATQTIQPESIEVQYYMRII